MACGVVVAAVVWVGVLSGGIWAQEGAQAPENQNGKQGQGSQSQGILGNTLPVFHPGKELLVWDGQAWKVTNNRLVEARFERYLNEPEETSEEDLEYNRIMGEILRLLAARDFQNLRRANPNLPGRALDEAFKLLPKAAQYRRDAMLCDAIANQVQAAWQAQHARERLAQANRALDEERKRLEWNTRMEASRPSLSLPSEKEEKALSERAARLVPLQKRLAEVEALQQANQVKGEMSKAQAQLEFQALIVDLFVGRRFQHTLIATRFYRAIFSEGEGRLKVGEDAQRLISRTTGMPPTVSVLDGLAGEALRDVAEGVEAVKFLLGEGEVAAAGRRLQEIYVIGEFLPEIRTFPRTEKRRVLDYFQKTRRLAAALEARDFGLAEEIYTDLKANVRDFDDPMAASAIAAAKQAVQGHLARARHAALTGDRATMEEALQKAGEVWPRHPEIEEIAGRIFKEADLQQRALNELDELLAQKNFRRIAEEKGRFIAATAQSPEKAAELERVLHQMAALEMVLKQAEELQKRGDSAGAWEVLEKAQAEFPPDPVLAGVRAELTTRAADFVSALRKAEELEQKGQHGASLSWYLKARQIYPPSEFAAEGVKRLSAKILPDGSLP